MIIDLFVYTHTFASCGFEYRCGWHALMREKWALFQSLYILSLIHPSGSLVVDESFGSWISQKPDDMPDALPHTQKSFKNQKVLVQSSRTLSRKRRLIWQTRTGLHFPLVQHGCFGSVSHSSAAIGSSED